MMRRMAMIIHSCLIKIKNSDPIATFILMSRPFPGVG
jgi:hypothetical protein